MNVNMACSFGFSEYDAILNIVRGKYDDPTYEISFQDLKDELLTVEPNEFPKYHVNIKENYELALIYYDDYAPNQDIPRDPMAVAFERCCRSLIIDKETLRMVATQFNTIVHNEEACGFLEKKPWDRVVVNESVEGTTILVFYWGGRWYVTTRRCLNASYSEWIHGLPYYDMFMEAIDGCFELDDLDVRYCYHFILVHHFNRNIVTFDEQQEDYKYVIHIMTTKIGELVEVPYVIGHGVKTLKDHHFDSLDALLAEINRLNNADEKRKKVTTEGFVLKCYEGKPYKSPFTILKIQTPLYDTLRQIKPNHSNLYQSFLMLFASDMLWEFIPYFTSNKQEGLKIMNMIDTALYVMAKEVITLYKMTRELKSPDVYNEIPALYHKILYEIHGIYLERKAIKEEEAGALFGNRFQKPKSICIRLQDVYEFLKMLDPHKLVRLFLARIKLKKLESVPFLNDDVHENYHMDMLSYLMFRDFSKLNS